jgi:RNA polymerase sigma factor (sigma-70 family)
MSDDLSVTDLVTRAADADERAWDALVDRYAPLIWSICRKHGLDGADADNIGQVVWLQFSSQLGKLHDPAAIAGWLAATARWECGKARRSARELQGSGRVPDAESIPDEQTGTAEQELLAAERNAVLREAVTRLSPCCQQLIAMLIEDPPAPYAQISATLGIPIGSIGPSRVRCLDKLRRDPAVAVLISPDAASAGGELSGQAAAR